MQNNKETTTYTTISISRISHKEGLAELALRPHGVVLAVRADVKLVEAGALRVFVALAESFATIADVRKVTPGSCQKVDFGN